MQNYKNFITLFNCFDAIFIDKEKHDYLYLFKPFLQKFNNLDKVSFDILFSFLISSANNYSDLESYENYLNSFYKTISTQNIENMSSINQQKMDDFFRHFSDTLISKNLQIEFMSFFISDLINKKLNDTNYLINFVLNLKELFKESHLILNNKSCTYVEPLDLLRELYILNKQHYDFYLKNIKPIDDKEQINEIIYNNIDIKNNLKLRNKL